MSERRFSFTGFVTLWVLHLEGEQCALQLVSTIERLTRIKYSLGGVYTTLNRLEAQGLVQRTCNPADRNPGAARRKYFKLTPRGKEETLTQGQLLRSLLGSAESTK